VNSVDSAACVEWSKLDLNWEGE